MSLEEKINTDLKAAMLSKNEAALRGLRAVKSALLLAKTSGTDGVSAEDEIKILQKLVKQRKESVEIYKQQNREDLAKGEIEEIGIIEKYLPQMMSEAEIKTGIQAIIAQVGAKGPGDLGKVMGAASKNFAGKADNKMVSQLVKDLLSAM
ncbi:MAG: GatB/YqeY domain-containing protein [Bacteroidota bacterium]